jgi:hypothetical protein
VRSRRRPASPGARTSGHAASMRVGRRSLVTACERGSGRRSQSPSVRSCRVECGTTRSDFEAVNPADIATLNFPIRAITNCDRNQGPLRVSDNDRPKGYLCFPQYIPLESLLPEATASCTARCCRISSRPTPRLASTCACGHTHQIGPPLAEYAAGSRPPRARSDRMVRHFQADPAGLQAYE